MLNKDVKFQIKAVDEQGVFTGLAAVYGNIDLGGDLIAPGAFTKTLAEKNGEAPILWQHDTHEPIGMGYFEDSEDGLHVRGELVLESPVAQKAYALMKKGVLKGLSIGYDSVASDYDPKRDVRTLRELKLWETSLVTFPMNPLAGVSGVKALTEEIDEIAETIEKRSAALRLQIKAGRTLSAATTERLRAASDAMEAAHGHIKALLDPEDVDKAAAIRNAEPEGLHSAVNSLESMLAKALGS